MGRENKHPVGKPRHPAGPGEPRLSQRAPRENSCWRKLCPDVVHDFTGFTTEPIKDIMKETVDMAKEGGAEWGAVYRSSFIFKLVCGHMGIHCVLVCVCSSPSTADVGEGDVR